MAIMDKIKNSRFNKSAGIFGAPKEAKEAGFEEFRPISGWKPLIHMEPGPRTSWINEDLAPTPIQMRVWTWFSFVALWYSTNYGAGSWSTGAALINTGLTMYQAMGVAALGCVLTSAIGTAAGHVGAVYHIGYPTWSRTTYGMYGSKIMVAFRGVVAVIWYAVQTFYGAKLLSVVLRAIFGNAWQNIPNTLPASSGTNTREMTAYFIMWFIQIPFNFIHPSAARHIFSIKSIVLPVSAFAFLGGLIKLAGGSINFDLVNTGSPKSGAAFSWAFLTGVNAIFGTISPMLINQPDIGRYANKPSAALWPQFASMVTGKFLCFFLGIISSAACKQIYGVTAWNVWDICGYILDKNGSGGWRAGLALFGIVQCFGTVATNLFANSIPFGCDMAGVFPKYVNIIRGQVACMLLSWAVCPWLILTSGAKFITFLGSYTVFMAALMGTLLADFYVIRRGNLHVPSMYAANGDKPIVGSLYMPRPGGYELKSFFSWFAGSIVCVPGLAYSYTTDTSDASVAFKRIYNTGFLVAFFISFFMQIGLSLIWPVKVMPDEFAHHAKTFEYLGPSGGYFPGEPEILYGRGSSKVEDIETSSAAESGSGSQDPEKYDYGVAKDDARVRTMNVVSM